jgi:hypothetical protein
MQIGSSVSAPSVSFTDNINSAGDYRVTLYGKPPYGRFDLSRAASQTISNNSNTAIQWTTQSSLLGAFSHSTVSNPERITCNASGIILVTATVPFDTNSTGVRQGMLTPDNGVTTYSLAPTSPSGYMPLQLHAHIPVTSGQIFRVYVYQNSGGNLDVLAGSQIQAHYVDVLSSYSRNGYGNYLDRIRSNNGIF